MFEPGKKYIFSRTAFWNDIIPGSSGFVPQGLSWINELDGHVFVGVGGDTQIIIKGPYRLNVFPEWCIEAEVELI